MTLKVIEGSWEEILQHAAELQGHRLRVIVLPEHEAQPKLTGAELAERMRAIGFIGQWADRSDLPDSPEYVRQLRYQIESRSDESSAGH